VTFAKGFPPLARRDARVLILGSMPGAESLRRRRYYAHPHNQFWPILGALLGFDTALPYARRVAVLKSRGLAVWDVLERCQRPGSLDTSIVRGSEVANDFRTFLKTHPRIRAVFFNGSKAEQAFRRHVLPRLAGAKLPHFIRLPSTSPAHAGMNRQAKLAAWRRIGEFL
jgi:TDG/mug DNA glycosylase family protein